jgi:DNA-binding transcriptional LysR family regulator
VEQAAALKMGRIDIGFGRLLFEDDGLTRRVIREEKLSVAVPHGHLLSRIKGPLTRVGGALARDRGSATP